MESKPKKKATESTKAAKMPPQSQKRQPGMEAEMRPRPRSGDPNAPSCGRLRDRIALITGGDSGIGRAVAIAFAREGADVAIAYLDEHKDAEEAQKLVEEAGGRCLLLSGDVGDEDFCKDVVARVIENFGKLDILVNNAAEQHLDYSLEDISREQLEKTFRTNLFAYFYLTKAALPHLKKGASIINTTSITAYKGNPRLVDYASTKGAIVTFTRSLSLQLADRGIRVNGVAPGPIWTPLIPASFPPDQVAEFGTDTPMKRPGQPEEVAGSFVFLASDDASYMSGQVLHPNGGQVVNG